MFYKKFSVGIDMRGNKIINSYVDNPTADNQLSNKIYVDLSNKFNTANAINKPASTKFAWVTNVANLPLKEVLDKLLYPVVFPVYTNPELKSYKFINLGNQSNVLGEKITGRLEFTISPSSRTPTTTYKLIVKYLNGTELIFSSTNSKTIDFSFVWNNISSVKLTQTFTSVTFLNDSDGNLYVDNNFATTLDFSNVFNNTDFVVNFNILPAIYNKLGVDETNIQEWIEYNPEELFNELTLNNSIQLEAEPVLSATNSNSCLILVPSILINKNCNITFTLNNQTISSINNPIKKYLLLDESNSFITVVHNNETFYYGIIDFGRYSSVFNVLLSF